MTRTLLALVLIFAAQAADACTTFCTRGLFGRNYDWNIGHGMITVNKRGMSKSSAAPDQPAGWISRYGSVTFNQYGRDNPTGGMNEAGLVVELMWLDGTQYPKPDVRKEVGALEWIQYQLDNASSVAEVIVNTKRVRIVEDATPLHYLVADARGNVATIEFLGGQLVVNRGQSLALANDAYSDSVAAMQKGASDRFARATKGLAAATTVDAAFKLLDEVAQPHTQWSIVYDIPNRRITWRTKANRERRSLALATLDFGCTTPVQIADIDGALILRDYTTAQNLALVQRSVRGTSFLKDMPEAKITESARWPEKSQCVISRGR